MRGPLVDLGHTCLSSFLPAEKSLWARSVFHPATSHPAIHLYIQTHTHHPSIHPSVCPPTHLSSTIYPPIHPTIHPSIHPTTHLSFCICMHTHMHQKLPKWLWSRTPSEEGGSTETEMLTETFIVSVSEASVWHLELG